MTDERLKIILNRWDILEKNLRDKKEEIDEIDEALLVAMKKAYVAGADFAFYCCDFVETTKDLSKDDGD